VLARRLSVCLSTLLAIGFASAPAQAQEFVDVAALEAQVEAAAELTELPAEPDWGVPDPSNSHPAVTQDAPEVPSPPPEVAEVAPEPRYHAEEAQYHAEYQAPAVDPAPPPAAGSASQPTGEERAQPVAPEPARIPVEPPLSPAAPEEPSTPTIWVWVWNWTWVQESDERYRNSSDQYRVDRIPLDQNLTRIIEKMGSQIPVQISVQTGEDIAGEIMEEVARNGVPVPAVPVAAPAAATLPSEYHAPTELKKSKRPSGSKPAPGPAALERPHGAPLELATLASRSRATTETSSATRLARRAGKAPSPRRATRPAPNLPLPSERITDATTASGVSAGIFLKSFAVLIASMLLAALGSGRRLRLPSTRLRGLLGTRTDPPG
jgi:hypothetical protein